MINKMEEFLSYIKDCNQYGKKTLIKGLIDINKLYFQKYFIRKILDFAKEQNLKFTFFITAKNLKKKQWLIKRLIDDGHEIGCHGYNHIFLECKNYERIYKEIEKTYNEFKKYKIPFHGFRAPFLSCNEYLIKILKEFNFIYSSNKLGESLFKYKNGIIEANIIKPYDWQAVVAYKWPFDKLLKEWKGKKGTLLLHPWVIAKHIELFKEFLGENKDYKIISNLCKDKLSVSFDAY